METKGLKVGDIINVNVAVSIDDIGFHQYIILNILSDKILYCKRLFGDRINTYLYSHNSDKVHKVNKDEWRIEQL